MLLPNHRHTRPASAAGSHAFAARLSPVVRWQGQPNNRRQRCLAVASAERAAPGQADNSAAAAQSRPNPLLPALRPQVYLQFCQVANKQVITRSKGKNLGTVKNFWVDPRSGRVVSFDLDEKKSLTSTRIANIPLSSLRQIGDVVLVNDDEAASQQPYDDRYGFVALIGMNVRTRSGTNLGKVRDVMFSPDTGAISRIAYDQFGLSFLPRSFFDLWSFSSSFVAGITMNEITVYDDVLAQLKKDSEGVFASIPKLLGSLGSGDTMSTVPVSRQLGTTTDAYGGMQQQQLLPAGYTRERWEHDIRQWERETGWTYAEYVRVMERGQGQGQAPAALAAPAARQQYAQPQPQAATYPYGQPPQQQQQQQQAWGDARFRGAPAAAPQGRYPPQQRVPQQQDPRARSAQYGGAAAPAAAPAAAAGYDAWPQQSPGYQQQPQQYQQPQQFQQPQPQKQPMPMQQQAPAPPSQQQQPARAALPQQQPSPAAAPQQPQQPAAAAAAGGGPRMDDWLVRSQAQPEPMLAGEQYQGRSNGVPAADNGAAAASSNGRL